MAYTIDDRSKKNIATLEPRVQVMAEAFLAKANAFLEPSGVIAKVISGTRTYAEQDALYAKRPKVTNARGGYSNHNFGVAFDIGLFKGSDYLEDSPLYESIAPIGKQIGLEWGGDWKSIKDYPHYEYPTGLTMEEKRARHDAGKSVI